MSYIGLLDCNNFFVSCERLFRPDLKNRPTVVLSSNDGCAVARSQEVKDLGIPMGIPYFQVKDELKKHEVAIFSSNFQLYRDISRRVMEVLKSEVGIVEQYSVDESFFKITEKENEVIDLLTHLKATVEKRVGIPVSLGAAKTKTIAKYASEHEKRGLGVCFLTGESWIKLMPEIPVSSIWGVGGKTSAKMKEHNLRTVADLLAADSSRVDRLFGISGMRLISELSEIPVHKLGSATSLQKSIMSTRSFSKETKSLSVLEDSITYHITHAAEELRSIGAEAACIRVIIKPSRHGDWALRGGAKETVLTAPTSDTRVLLREALLLAKDLFEPEVPYKKAGVVLSHINSTSVGQADLFTDLNIKKDSSALMEVVDSLNKKLGKGHVTIGRLGSGAVWQSSRGHISPQYTTQWTDIQTVQA